MASGFPFPFINIVDETARQLGLSTSEALELITRGESFQELVNQGTDPLTAARVVATGKGTEALPEPPGGGLLSPDTRQRANEFREKHPVSDASQPVGQQAPQTRLEGLPKPGDAGFVGPMKPKVSDRVNRFLDRIGPDLPFNVIRPEDPDILKVVKAFGNILAASGKIRGAKEMRGREEELFELEKEGAELDIALTKEQIAESQSQRRINKVVLANTEKELIDAMNEDFARHPRSEQAKLIRAGATPDQLFEHLNNGEIDEFNRKRRLYIPAAELERQTVSAALFADEQIREDLGLETMEDAVAFYDTRDARSVINDLLNQQLQKRVFELEIAALEREDERDVAKISLDLTSMYDGLLQEEAEIASKLATAEAFQRILNTGTPEQQKELQLQLGVTPIDLVENSPEQFRVMLNFIEERKQKLLDSIDRFGIPDLRKQLELRVAPEVVDREAEILAIARSLGLVDESTKTHGEDKDPLLQRAAQWMDDMVSALSPFRLIPDEGRTQRTLERVTPGFEDVFKVFQRGFNFFSRATLDASVNRALDGEFEDQHSFQLLKQKLSEELARMGFTPEDEDLTHDAAVIAWYANNRPGERAPKRLLKIVDKLPKELRTPPNRER